MRQEGVGRRVAYQVALQVIRLAKARLRASKRDFRILPAIGHAFLKAALGKLSRLENALGFLPNTSRADGPASGLPLRCSL